MFTYRETLESHLERKIGEELNFEHRGILSFRILKRERLFKCFQGSLLLHCVCGSQPNCCLPKLGKVLCILFYHSLKLCQDLQNTQVSSYHVGMADGKLFDHQTTSKFLSEIQILVVGEILRV